MNDWSNWAGNQHAAGARRIAVDSADALAAAVASTAAAGGHIRPIGSGHSFTAIGVPRDVQLDLSEHSGIVHLDPATGLVQVNSGTTIRRLNHDLAAAGFALTNLGDIDAQTIAGAVSTGTHGTGLRFGGIATQIRGLELVQPDGSVLSCSATENTDVFAHARVGLGALGVISTITLQAVPLFALRAQEGPMALAEVLDRIEDLSQNTDHFEFYWFPHTDRTLTKRNTRVDLVDGLDRLSPRRQWWDDEFLSNTVFGGIIAAGRRFPPAVRGLNQITARALGAREFTDVAHRVFVSARRVRFIEMEYALPRAELGNLLLELRDLVERNRWRIAFPVEIRVAAADDIPLSTAYGRDTAYVAIHMPSGVDHGPYFAALERLASAVAGRPHWGKMHYLEAATLRERYPRFDEFVRIRDRLDPRGTFGNDYLDRVLGGPSDPHF